MRKGWEYKRFTEVCDVTYGYAFDSKCFTDNPEDTPLIRIRDVKRGFSETFYNGEIPDGYKVMEGDYLVGMDGEFNIGQWGKRPGVLNQRVCKMNSSSSELINQYMYYFMKVCLKSIEDETPFVTVKHLSAKRINQIQIPLPPLSTQLAIVSELDKINELIRLKKEQLKDFDNLAQSLFYEMFGDPVENEKGWNKMKWKDVLTIINGKNQSAVVDENGDYPIYGSGGIMGYANNWLCPEKCTIIGRKGNINKPIFVESKFWNVDTAFGLKPNIEILSPRFLFYFCLNYNFERHNKAVTIPSLTKADLLKIDIPLPPLSLQRLFAQRIEQIEREKSEVQKSIQDLETLLASRMQYWFE